MKANAFEVLRVMEERHLNLRLTPLDNVLTVRRVPGGTEVTICVAGDVLEPLTLGRFVGGLILANKAQFDQVREELEARVLPERISEAAGDLYAAALEMIDAAATTDQDAWADAVEQLERAVKKARSA
jgi:hypothetical protein